MKSGSKFKDSNDESRIEMTLLLAIRICVGFRISEFEF